VHVHSRSRRRGEPTAAAAVPRTTPATRLARQRPVRPNRRTATSYHAPPGGPPTLDRCGRAALGLAPTAGPVAEHVGAGRDGSYSNGPGESGRRAHRVHRVAPTPSAPPAPTPSAPSTSPSPPPASFKRDAGATAAAVAAASAPEPHGGPSLGHDRRSRRFGPSQSAAPPPSPATTATATRSRTLVAPTATAPAASAAPAPATAYSTATATGKRLQTYYYSTCALAQHYIILSPCIPFTAPPLLKKKKMFI